jgi:hypothetical protein
MKFRSLTTWLVMGFVIAPLALESLSSYVIFRKVARHGSHPKRLATVELIRQLYYRVAGRKIVFSADHGPLFFPEATYGYAAHPGHYEIIEDFDGQRHRFSLTIDEAGQRISSYYPQHRPRRIIFGGDSGIFGWGLNDQETVPWLLQARLPTYEVLNWSLTGFGTVHTLMQMQQESARITPDDLIILTYHPLTRELDAALPETFQNFHAGLEVQLAGEHFLDGINLPYGTIGSDGKLTIERISMRCLRGDPGSGCQLRKIDLATQIQVSERAFDAVMALHMGRVIVAIVGGTGTDPVIEYLQAKGVFVVDLRPGPSDPESMDVVATDDHGGPHWSYFLYDRLYSALRSNGYIN